eukprot:PhF_6_TR5640/c0_g1_i1/m.8226
MEDTPEEESMTVKHAYPTVRGIAKRSSVGTKGGSAEDKGSSRRSNGQSMQSPEQGTSITDEEYHERRTRLFESSTDQDTAGSQSGPKKETVAKMCSRVAFNAEDRKEYSRNAVQWNGRFHRPDFSALEKTNLDATTPSVPPTDAVATTTNSKATLRTSLSQSERETEYSRGHWSTINPPPNHHHQHQQHQTNLGYPNTQIPHNQPYSLPPPLPYPGGYGTPGGGMMAPFPQGGYGQHFPLPPQMMPQVPPFPPSPFPLPSEANGGHIPPHVNGLPNYHYGGGYPTQPNPHVVPGGYTQPPYLHQPGGPPYQQPPYPVPVPSHGGMNNNLHHSSGFNPAAAPYHPRSHTLK